MSTANLRSLLPAIAAIVLPVWLSARPSVAETRRIAVVVGSNMGDRQHVALRYAESDAGKLARLLVELGGVSPANVLLLQGRDRAAIQSAVDAAKVRTESWHREPDTRVAFIFYFSGHSDGERFEIGDEKLTFSDVRRWISYVGADVRVVIVDSCKSGSLLQSKGGTKVEPFEIHLQDDLPNSGEAVMTSSAANESSLESAEIRGSFFTHHLLSGLRGAADRSGDGQVSLTEAYEYAFTHTTSATANTTAGTQHPSYDYRLSGQGELMLTDLRGRSAVLTVPNGYERVLVTHLLRDQVVVELTTGSRTRLALHPGAYSVRAWKQDREFFAHVDLADSDDRTLRIGELTELHAIVDTQKGIFQSGSRGAGNGRESGWDISGAVGLTTGVAQGLGPMTTARIALDRGRLGGFTMSLDTAVGRGSDYSEYRSTLSFGYRISPYVSGPLSMFVAAETGAGVIGQRSSAGGRAATPTIGASPRAGAGWQITRLLVLDVEADVLFALYRRDGRTVVSPWPAAYLGATFMR